MVHKIDLIEWDDRAKGKFPLLEELKQLRAINAELLAVLQAVEWVETNEILAHGGGNYEARCPWCGALGQNPPYWWKHEPDCPRQAAIRKAQAD